MDEKRSGYYIAAELGITRNAVMGAVWRLGLKRAAVAKVKAVKVVKVKVERVKLALPLPEPEAQDEAPVQDEARPPQRCVPLAKLTTEQCRWPLEGNPPYMFCGGPKLKGSSYCETHSALAVVEKSKSSNKKPPVWVQWRQF